MITVGIDQSYTSTGVVVIHDDFFESLIITTQPNKEDPLEKFRRAEYIAEHVVGMIASVEGEVDKVYIEGLGFAARGDATRDLGGLQYMIVNRLIYSGLPPVIIAPTSLKKRFAGHGKATKDDMVEAVQQVDQKAYQEMMGIPKSKGRYDMADAYALAHIARAEK